MGSMIAGWVDDVVPVDVCRQFTTERYFFEVWLGPLHGKYLDMNAFLLDMLTRSIYKGNSTWRWPRGARSGKEKVES